VAHQPAAQPSSLAAVPVGQFVADLASSAPTPGGGSGAALIGATAASLLSMVAELSAGKPALAPFGQTIYRAGRIGRRAGEELLRLDDWNAEAFGAFMDTWRRTKDQPEDARREARSAAARSSAEAPRRMLDCCTLIAEACERLAGRSSPSLASDLMCASYAVEAAARCAAENVYANLGGIAERAEAEALRSEALEMVAAVERDARACRRHIARGAARKPERLRSLLPVVGLF
jgi:formiminotetrahydrofolate cyclodeaminase